MWRDVEADLVGLVAGLVGLVAGQGLVGLLRGGRRGDLQAFVRWVSLSKSRLGVWQNEAASVANSLLLSERCKLSLSLRCERYGPNDDS